MDNLLPAVCAGAAASIVVTPLDVLKVRLQLAAPLPRTTLPCRPHSGVPTAYRCLLAVESLPHGCFPSRAWAQHMHALHPVRVAPKASSFAAAHPDAILTSHASGLAATFRQIIREEGVRAFWKGLDTSMLLNIPMVTIYMTMYDSIHHQLNKNSGLYAPAIAGMVARTATVLATAPLELVRTRQQASVSPSRLMSSLAAAWQGTASSEGGMASAHATLAKLRGLWTGVGATLARDLPFTVIYWCTVEPMRAFLLSDTQHQTQTQTHTRAAAHQAVAGSTSQDGSAPSTTASVSQEQHTASSRASQPPASEVERVSHHSTTGSEPGTASLPLEPTPSPLIYTAERAQPSMAQQVLWANLVAGSTAGALAAAVTTPFDVLKTRLQTGTGLGAQTARNCCTAQATQAATQPSGVLAMLHGIWKAEGLQGLFAGGVPRVARAAPACAIVLSTYEVLKLWGLQQ